MSSLFLEEQFRVPARGKIQTKRIWETILLINHEGSKEEAPNDLHGANV